ncbi:ATPase [Geothrix rubra]|uniref:ATPase n=2 Tax=Geothrix rubra TaxID=2927977 RepID=A0ABQ5Q7G7_9BACT|nr:ATPase [Geothrix rubra]
MLGTCLMAVTMAAAPRTPSPSSLDLEGFAGLAEEEARRRLEREGPNELPARGRRGILAIAWEVVREPMFLMLVAAGGLYLAMGEPRDALMLLGFVLVVMGITILQERRTEHALEALRDLSSPRALVIRDGRQRRIPGREVVPGDVLILVEGDRVPADALLRAGLHLSVDESLLTGESVAVRKAASTGAAALEAPGGDDLPSLFSGTLVTAGQGVAEVLGTGLHTELGRIGKALQQVEPESTFLQKETGRLVRTFALVSLVACAAVVVLYPLTRGGGAQVWKEGLLAGIALAMATLPEEFPVVLTVFLALGAWRISRSQVLTRRMPAIETLGAATVLCVDKTGTLTLNQMTLRRLDVPDLSLDLTLAGPELPEPVHALMEYAILASKRDPFDPMERALHEAGKRWLMATEHLHPDWSLAREYPLDPDLLAVTHAWNDGHGQIVVATKGAPEAVVDLCHLSPERRAEVDARVAELASQGLRVLGVARGQYAPEALPEGHHDLELAFLGLLGLEDPVRPTVPAAVAECRTAGIRVVMITGDYPATAVSIARQAGLSHPERVLTGPELNRLSDAELAARIGEVQVFARVVPEQKLRLVTALKANREVVAMTGDGVNDAPALKAAHIGVAMGGRGTDVAREAASLVLLDDDFSSIVAAIRLGRRIFDNIRKAVAFIVAVHIPIAGLSLLPVFFPGWPLLLLPVHIVFLELVIDPSCSLVFEAEEAEADVMRRPPRDAQEPLFTLKAIGLAVLQGTTALGACLAVYLLARPGHGHDAARALTFAAMVVSFLAIILANRSWTQSILGSLRNPNPALWWVLGGTLACLALVLAWPVAQRLFHFAPLQGRDLLLAAAAGFASILWFEAFKFLRHRPKAPAGG